MTYSDNPRINEAVDLLMHDRMRHPWCPAGVPSWPPKTRAEIIGAVRDEFGVVAAGGVKITVH
ncbi:MULTISPECIES: hypothetical protein [unclassified Bradyrhizobium]|uniref:hypothetical protein n=1 Tax=unclassified Bradyrhizobium TaxID=2631580 RepID=UPI0029162C0D|nr:MULTISPECIES: hypothetical protein [unclassified Bradyrhizobium]